MNSKIIAVVIVAILAVAGIGVVVLTTGNDDSYQTVETNRLVVYGNANNDDTINDHDLDIVKSIADGESVWDSQSNPFADTNADGVIDSKDVDLLEKIIKKEPCEVYYRDYQGDAVRVDYPLVGKIGTMYYQQAQLAILLGLWDNVTACCERSMNDVTSPGYLEKFSYGDGYNVDPELVLKSGVDTIICYTQTDTTAPDMKKLVNSTGADLNVLCINHESLLECVVTYGFLFDVTEKSLEYAKLADECSASLYECMKDVPTDEQPSVAIVMLYGTATTDKIRVLGYSETGNKHNLAKLINSVPNVNWIRADLDSPSYGTYVTSEWFLENQPDYIILVGSSMGTSSDMSLDEIKNVYYTKCEEVFGKTNAFNNGHIIAASNGLLNGYSNPLVSLKLLSYVYDEIDDKLAEEAYNQWYDKYALHTVEEYPSESIFYVTK